MTRALPENCSLVAPGRAPYAWNDVTGLVLEEKHMCVSPAAWVPEENTSKPPTGWTNEENRGNPWPFKVAVLCAFQHIHFPLGPRCGFPFKALPWNTESKPPKNHSELWTCNIWKKS